MKTPHIKSTMRNAYSASTMGGGRSAMVVMARVDQKNDNRYMRLSVALALSPPGSSIDGYSYNIGT